MSFTKSELQSIRTMLSNDIDQIQFTMGAYSRIRRELFSTADINDPNTTVDYETAKSVSNRLRSDRKKLVRKEAILRKVKSEIVALDSQPKNFVERFFSAVRGE